jgi:hypothetical protein
LNRRNGVIAGAVLIVLGALVWWIARNTYFEEITVPTPWRNEAATNPFYAAQRFVEELGSTSTWDRLQTDVPSDAVIVVSSWHWDLAEGRRSRMERWVENGGRLVLDRTLVGGQEAFEKWSGIQRIDPKSDEEEAEDEDDTGGRISGVRERPHLRECRTLHESMRGVGSRAGMPTDYELCGGDDGTHLTTTRAVDWALQDNSGNQVLRVRVGKGSVTVINAVPFRYVQFLKGDHPSLLVGAAQLRHGDEVHFLSEEEHASLLTLMWIFGWPVVVLALALIGLALWRNSVRFGPLTAQPESARRSLAEQIRGTGQFALRFGGGKGLHAATVRALNEAAARRISGYARLSTADRIEAVARLSGIETGVLGPAIHHASRRSHELRQAIALIETARRRILIDKKRSPVHGS